MLFISRRVYDDTARPVMLFGVVDTDDGVEEIVSKQALGISATLHGLEIGGYIDSPKGSAYVRTVPYQPQDTMTPVQTKTSVLKHVDVTTYGKLITSITWHMEDFEENAVIRLSDFGTKCADFLLYDDWACLHSDIFNVTLVFDDKIKSVANRAFMLTVLPTRMGCGLNYEDVDGEGWQAIGVSFDMREVTNEFLAEKIYMQLFERRGVFEAVIDAEERKLAMQAKWEQLGHEVYW